MLLLCPKVFLNIISWFFLKNVFCTVDLNAAELQYLADHLTREECRQLVAAAHLKGYEEPPILDQVERTISKDLPCIELLHHWNSQSGEGKGETHEILEHRLRQIGKDALADWLGKTVFHEIGKDLNDSLEKGFKGFVAETRVRFKKAESYNIIDETSDSESEDKFDVREYTDKVNLSSEGDS
ncbi:uncharacterized protein LOC108905091 [Anoplophora glabripennis]|uniref:uncharacterized protein LOC108905091 n=1 Tax=Anoplophora glabripennis TaxID=217634 RepID=UPI000874E242|nr:uncharacterized protein LOC108905091 [Anoplophora glabripennis]